MVPPEDQTERERRIARVVDLMSQGLWLAGQSHRQLSEEWGISVSTVKDIAAEANRIIRNAIGEDKELIRTRLLAAIDNVRLRARAWKRTHYRTDYLRDKEGKILGRQKVPYDVAEPNFTAELKALELYARALGLLTEVREIRQGDQFEDWSDEQLERFAAGDEPVAGDSEREEDEDGAGT